MSLKVDETLLNDLRAAQDTSLLEKRGLIGPTDEAYITKPLEQFSRNCRRRGPVFDTYQRHFPPARGIHDIDHRVQGFYIQQNLIRYFIYASAFLLD